MTNETLLNGRYELQAQQGSGGMSVIYKALDRELQRTVAVKILRPSLTQDPSFLEKFRNEARSVANLSHPNIVTVHDVGSDGSAHYIVMEFVEGQDLKKIIKARGALPVDRVVDLAIQICGGIGYAHRSGLVHADVKPQNILVTSQDIVKVTDFGIAQALSDTQPQQRASVVWGSPHYFAPEQARGEQPTPAADVYAIGIVIFEMLTGRLPYIGANHQELALAHIRERVPMVTEFNPSVPESLAKIVYKVMSKEPAGRYRTADQLGHVLQSYRDRARERTVSSPQVSPSSDPSGAPEDENRFARPRSQSYQGSPLGSEPTVRYSAAPEAPAPYRPQQPGQGMPSPNPSAVSAPQPFEQRYAAQAGAGAQAGSVPQPAPMPYYRSPSGPLPAIEPGETDEGIDFVTVVLAFLALIAVGGLCPLLFAVLSAYA
ncbi:serine/threonine protein kinase [Phototrophicus methaneseepsis]|uniref:non-specific serine/threonine protein kinase n=1 Tax=Phototrophicus methaneseepsis TaxID=2710758 RepID=A0A7S8E5X9_9CHLR|nr:protein kinase [Phototrophicus methaneseepsis]QPC80961.1 serine/threonine protein kinase [Phototrophicus methaneseepsis]